VNTTKAPFRLFIEPKNTFTNEAISQNSNGLAWESKIKYKNETLKVWETNKISFIIFLRKSAIGMPGLQFEVYAEINWIIQKWRLYKFIGRMTKPAKERKRLKKIIARR
jgi:hypothetical protein